MKIYDKIYDKILPKLWESVGGRPTLLLSPCTIGLLARYDGSMLSPETLFDVTGSTYEVEKACSLKFSGAQHCTLVDSNGDATSVTLTGDCVLRVSTYGVVPQAGAQILFAGDTNVEGLFGLIPTSGALYAWINGVNIASNSVFDLSDTVVEFRRVGSELTFSTPDRSVTAACPTTDITIRDIGTIVGTGYLIGNLWDIYLAELDAEGNETVIFENYLAQKSTTGFMESVVGPTVKLNGFTLPDDITESVLYGHEWENFSEVENRIRYSEDLTIDSWWSHVKVTVNANETIAPDGKLTADAVVADSTPDTTHEIVAINLDGLEDNVNYTASIYVKAREISLLRFLFRNKAGDTSPFFTDLITGEVVDGVGTVEDAGNGWWKISKTENMASGAVAPRIYMALGESPPADYVFEGNVEGMGLYMWGCHICEAESDKAYVRTTNHPIVGKIPADSTNLGYDVAGGVLTNPGVGQKNIKVQGYTGNWSGTESLAIPSLTGSETVVDQDGTSTLAVNAGSISFTAGTCSWFELSNGDLYLIESAKDSLQPTVYNRVANARHATLQNATLGTDGFWSVLKDGSRLMEGGFTQSENLVYPSEPENIGQLKTSGGTVSVVEATGDIAQFSDYVVNLQWDAGGSFGYSYGDGTLETGVFDLLVQMDDGGVPVVGASGDNTADFQIIFDGGSGPQGRIEHVTGTVYKVSCNGGPGSALNNFGLVKYSTQSSRGVSFTRLHQHDGTQAYIKTTTQGIPASTVPASLTNPLVSALGQPLTNTPGQIADAPVVMQAVECKSVWEADSLPQWSGNLWIDPELTSVDADDYVEHDVSTGISHLVATDGTAYIHLPDVLELGDVCRIGVEFVGDYTGGIKMGTTIDGDEHNLFDGDMFTFLVTVSNPYVRILRRVLPTDLYFKLTVEKLNDPINFLTEPDGDFRTFTPDDLLPQYGDDLVINGDFDTDSDWSKGAGVTISNGVASFVGVGASLDSLYQTNMIPSQYTTAQVSFEVKNYSSGGVFATFGGVVGADTSSPVVTEDGVYTAVLSVLINNNLIFKADGASTTLDVDNVRVREITGTGVETNNQYFYDGDRNLLIYEEPISGDCLEKTEDFVGKT